MKAFLFVMLWMWEKSFPFGGTGMYYQHYQLQLFCTFRNREFAVCMVWASQMLFLPWFWKKYHGVWTPICVCCCIDRNRCTCFNAGRPSCRSGPDPRVPQEVLWSRPVCWAVQDVCGSTGRGNWLQTAAWPDDLGWIRRSWWCRGKTSAGWVRDSCSQHVPRSWR